MENKKGGEKRSHYRLTNSVWFLHHHLLLKSLALKLEEKGRSSKKTVE
jgi:hypothetical protein